MSNSYPVTPLPYYFKGKELQPTKNNSYTFKEKVEICIKLNQEYKAGILSVGKLVWIWENGRFGKFTVECIIDDMLEKEIIKINPKKIIYVSCNPTTQARDVRELINSDYIMGAIQPIDMFPHTHHIECVITLDKK